MGSVCVCCVQSTEELCLALLCASFGSLDELPWWICVESKGVV